MKKTLVSLALILSACTVAPAATYTAPDAMPLFLQATRLAEQAEQVQVSIAQATQSRALTEQAIADAQAGTAFAVSIVGTQAAQTAIAPYTQAASTAFVATTNAEYTRSAQNDLHATSTAVAQTWIGRTATAEAEADYDTQRASKWLYDMSGSILAAALVAFGVVVLCVLAWLSVSFGVFIDRRAKAPMERNGRLFVDTRDGIREIPPLALAAPVQSTPAIETAPLPPNARQYRAFWVRACRYAGEFGTLNWRKGFDSVLRSGEWDYAVRDSLIKFGLAERVPSASGYGCKWASGWNATEAEQYFRDNVPSWTPSPKDPPRFVQQGNARNSQKQEAGGVDGLQQVQEERMTA